MEKHKVKLCVLWLKSQYLKKSKKFVIVDFGKSCYSIQ